jgi:uncharacterized metal-binding protein
MALSQECSLKCARKVLDTADIVREAFYTLQKFYLKMASAAGMGSQTH